MRDLARKPAVQDLPELRAPAPILEVGGPVAAMQQSLAERLAAPGAYLLPVPKDSLVDRWSAIASRLAGPVALGLGYLAAARLLAG